MSQGLGPELRLHDRRDFRRVFETGRKVVGRNLIVWYFQTHSHTPPRLGLSVSAKVGIAVRRNRLKRLAREAFRLNRAGLREGNDVVIYIRPGCRWTKRQDAERDLMDLCRKGGLAKV